MSDREKSPAAKRCHPHTHTHTLSLSPPCCEEWWEERAYPAPPDSKRKRCVCVYTYIIKGFRNNRASHESRRTAKRPVAALMLSHG